MNEKYKGYTNHTLCPATISLVTTHIETEGFSYLEVVERIDPLPMHQKGLLLLLLIKPHTFYDRLYYPGRDVRLLRLIRKLVKDTENMPCELFGSEMEEVRKQKW